MADTEGKSAAISDVKGKSIASSSSGIPPVEKLSISEGNDEYFTALMSYIRQQTKAPPEIVFHRPSPSKPIDMLAVSAGQIRAGMKIPITPYVGLVLKSWNLAPGQLSGNTWRALDYAEQLNYPPTDFIKYGPIMCKGQNNMFYCLRTRLPVKDDISVPRDDNDKYWREGWVFVSGPWDLNSRPGSSLIPSRWTPPISILNLKIKLPVPLNRHRLDLEKYKLSKGTSQGSVEKKLSEPAPPTKRRKITAPKGSGPYSVPARARSQRLSESAQPLTSPASALSEKEKVDVNPSTTMAEKSAETVVADTTMPEVNKGIEDFSIETECMVEKSVEKVNVDLSTERIQERVEDTVLEGLNTSISPSATPISDSVEADIQVVSTQTTSATDLGSTVQISAAFTQSIPVLDPLSSGTEDFLQSLTEVITQTHVIPSFKFPSARPIMVPTPLPGRDIQSSHTSPISPVSTELAIEGKIVMTEEVLVTLAEELSVSTALPSATDDILVSSPQTVVNNEEEAGNISEKGSKDNGVEEAADLPIIPDEVTPVESIPSGLSLEIPLPLQGITEELGQIEITSEMVIPTAFEAEIITEEVTLREDNLSSLQSEVISGSRDVMVEESTILPRPPVIGWNNITSPPSPLSESVFHCNTSRLRYPSTVNLHPWFADMSIAPAHHHLLAELSPITKGHLSALLQKYSFYFALGAKGLTIMGPEEGGQIMMPKDMVDPTRDEDLLKSLAEAKASLTFAATELQQKQTEVATLRTEILAMTQQNRRDATLLHTAQCTIRYNKERAAEREKELQEEIKRHSDVRYEALKSVERLELRLQNESVANREGRDAMRRKNFDLQTQLDDLNDQFQEQGILMVDKDSKIAEMEQSLKDLQAQLASKENDLAEVKSSATDMEEKLKDQQAKAVLKDNEISALQASSVKLKEGVIQALSKSKELQAEQLKVYEQGMLQWIVNNYKLEQEVERLKGLPEDQLIYSSKSEEELMEMAKRQIYGDSTAPSTS